MSSTERRMSLSRAERVPKSEYAYENDAESYISDYLAVAEELLEIECDFARWYGDP